GSSLGEGNVLVDGLLHLRGSKNIHSNAAVQITGGQVRIDPGVIIRIRQLQFGGNTYTSGRFSSNNAAPYIVGGGEFRVPATNTPPTIKPLPVPSSVYAGSDVTFQATPNDPDGEITKVEYALWENILILRATNAPWAVTLTNVN